MFASLLMKFRRDRKAATAMLMALMTVPMIIASGAAVDFSRVSSARAQLQAAVDSAAIAGVGAYNNAGGQTVGTGASQTTLANASQAVAIATANFNTATTNLNNYAVISNLKVTAGCQAKNAAQCGTALTTMNCPQKSGYYCVQVMATATLKTSLLALVIPNVVINANSLVTTPIPTLAIPPSSFGGPTLPNASDRNGIYAYAVPLDGNNNPEYGNLPPIYSSCTGPILEGPIQTAPTGSNTCNYYQVGDSSKYSVTSQTALQLIENASGQVIQPIAFLFLNFTGGTNSYGYKPQPDGGYCPDFTLYGAISQVSYSGTVNGKTATILPVPPEDSLNEYSSAYMALGQPPTYAANHPIIPFQIPAGQGGNTTVENCPYWYHNYKGATGTYTGYVYTNYLNSSNGITIVQPVQSDGKTYTAVSNAYPQWNATYFGWNTNSTTLPFPANSYTGGPLVVNGCTPNGSTLPWNYASYYSRNNLGNCANGTKANGGGGASTGQQANSANNCALIIQDFGPHYYYNSYLPSGYPAEPATPVLPVNFTNQLDGLTRPIILPNFTGAPTNSYPPDSTAHRCWDPSTAYTGLPTTCDGNTSCTFDTNAPDAKVTTPYDEIENPEAGAIFCNSQTPETYGLYWNDLGSNEGDDLGYWNAISLFTCSTPSINGAFGGPPTIYE